VRNISGGSSAMGKATFDPMKVLGHQMVFWDLVPLRNLGAFHKQFQWSGYLAPICSAILGAFLGKRKVGHRELQSPFYKTYLVRKWYCS
jgi:hypothetical protein